MSLALHAQIQGAGEPLLLLHGLFGSLENLGGLTRRLSDGWQIHALDLRNHGRSPHTDSMSYPEMAADVLAYMDRNDLNQASVLGHSMGGKIAMQLALDHPKRVDRLIVADIAPVDYPPRHEDVFEGLRAVDIDSLTSRRQADHAMSEFVTTPDIRSFLLKNIVSAKEGEGDGQSRYRWRLNLDVIEQDYAKISAAPESNATFDGPTLFLKGGDSDYIRSEYREQVMARFPNAQMRVIQETGHWLHAQKPDAVAAVCRRFLEGKRDDL